MSRKDIVELSELSYDEKNIVLRGEKNLTTMIELREAVLKRRFGFKYRVSVGRGFQGEVFLTRYFADKYFDELADKYDLKEEEDEDRSMVAV